MKGQYSNGEAHNKGPCNRKTRLRTLNQLGLNGTQVNQQESIGRLHKKTC